MLSNAFHTNGAFGKGEFHDDVEQKFKSPRSKKYTVLYWIHKFIIFLNLLEVKGIRQNIMTKFHPAAKRQKKRSTQILKAKFINLIAKCFLKYTLKPSKSHRKSRKMIGSDCLSLHVKITNNVFTYYIFLVWCFGQRLLPM